MKSMLFTLVIFLTIAVQNATKQQESLIPSCIQQKIDQIKQQPKWNPSAEVYEYNYKGRRVFFFSGNCCDQYNEVYDENCNYICAPTGGITGKGDRKCQDFISTATKVKLVWKDER